MMTEQDKAWALDWARDYAETIDEDLDHLSDEDLDDLANNVCYWRDQNWMPAAKGDVKAAIDMELIRCRPRKSHANV